MNLSGMNIRTRKLTELHAMEFRTRVLIVLLFTSGRICDAKPWLLKPHKYFSVTAEGCVHCYGVPVRYAKIQLKDHDPIDDDTMSTGRTDHNGCFRLSGQGRDAYDGKPDPFILIEYVYSGSYGKMEVEGLVFGKNRYDKTSTRSYKSYINFGTLNFNNIHCKCYTTFYDAIKDYRTRTSLALPYNILHIRTNVLLHGGAHAYATINVIRIPNGGYINKSLALHELAHTIRHSFDGNWAHLVWDAVRFWYMRNHTCSTRANNGYAFNEGWAEYWAGNCKGPYGNDENKFYYEGNVARGLRRLKNKCNSSDYKFVRVLKYNRGTIHSFYQFNNAHQKRYGCKL